MTVAIISEYNPFHTGHKYHVDTIRKTFGDSTDIVAIMSGNFTQRGEIAIADKYKRAEWAVLSGVNLVLELPFPYSMSSAEIFAKSAIKIIDSLKTVDYISFGSECGDIGLISDIAKNMQSEEYLAEFKKLSTAADTKLLGYPALSELAYKTAFSTELKKDFFSPNNILAIEYIKAIRELGSPLKVHTLKRFGAAYNETEEKNTQHQSAMYIRQALEKNDCKAALTYIPEEAKASFLENLNEGNFPTSTEKLSSAVISHFRLSDADEKKDIFDVGGGLYHRLKKSAQEADSISALISLTQTKKFTNARIRRGMWYSFFGVTSSNVKELPLFTHLLAFDTKGRALLKSIKERSDFPIITKPSCIEGLCETALLQKTISDKADAVFHLTKPKATSGLYSLKAKPFVKI